MKVNDNEEMAVNLNESFTIAQPEDHKDPSSEEAYLSYA